MQQARVVFGQVLASVQPVQKFRWGVWGCIGAREQGKGGQAA